MKNTYLFLTLLLFLSACSTVEIIEPEKEYVIQPYLTKLDSLGFDITNDSELFEIGYYRIYHGKNRQGNSLMEYALAKRAEITAEDYHSWSVQNTKNGNYAIAIDLLEKAMKMDPENVSAYYGWVLLYYYRDYEKALQVLEQHDAFTPNFSDAPMGEDIHYLKGLCHMQMQNYEKALEEFNTYINNIGKELGEDWVDVYTFVHKGRCLTELEKYDEAINSYNKAIKYYENCSEAYYFMGLTQLKMNNNTAACTNFNIALDLIEQGHGNADVYVEYFHEIYPQQIENSILENCSK